MRIIPWRTKSFFSRRVPLLYHILASLWKPTNSADRWNEKLSINWDSAGLQWPTKNKLIEAATKPEDVILDVACGTGTMLRYLKSRGYSQLWGLEHSQYVVERLGADGISMIKGSLPQISATTGKFDVVIASQILEHIIRRNRFLKEVSRVLKPGGCAHIFVPDNCLGPIDEPSHAAIYTDKTLQSLLVKHFVLEECCSMKDESFEMPILYAKVSKR